MDKMSEKGLNQCRSWLRHVSVIDKTWEDFLLSEIERIKNGEAPKAQEPCKGCGKPKKEFVEKVEQIKEKKLDTKISEKKED